MQVVITPALCASQVDPSVTFDQIGGLDGYIDKLKEMVFLPLVYPELFQRFNVTPPRGMLFYGPPGRSSPWLSLFCKTESRAQKPHLQDLC